MILNGAPLNSRPLNAGFAAGGIDEYVSEILSLAAAPAGLLKASESLIAALAVSAAAGGGASFVGDANESAVFDSATFLSFGGTLNESVEFTPALASRLVAAGAANEMLLCDAVLLSVLRATTSLSEVLALATAAARNLAAYEELLETVEFSVFLPILIDLSVDEGISFADRTALVYNDTVAETVRLAAAILSQKRGFPVAAEGIAFRTRLTATFTLVALESVAFADSLAYRNQFNAVAAELMRVHVSVAANARAQGQATAVCVLSAVAQKHLHALASDSLEVDDSIVVQRRLLASLQEDLLLEALIPVSAISAGAVASDQAVFITSAGTNVSVQEQLQEGLLVGLVGRLGDEEFIAWVLNTETSALSDYFNFPFNSLAATKNRVYGATDGGLYLLEGEDDAGTDIDAFFKTGLSDFGIGLKKRVHSAYIGLTSDGSMLLKVIASESGRKTETWYQLDETAESPETRRVKIGKGIKGRYFQFELRNIDGADFDVDSMELYPAVMTRRIRG